MKNYRSTVVGFAVLIVLLSAGAAQSLSGSNTVASDDIINGQVYGPDLANNAVSSPKVYDNSLTGADIRNSSLNGADIADNSIKGADVDESTLELPSSPGNGDTVYKWTVNYTTGGTPHFPVIIAEDELPAHVIATNLDIHVTGGDFSSCERASMSVLVGDTSLSDFSTFATFGRAEFDKSPGEFDPPGPGTSFAANRERVRGAAVIGTGSAAAPVMMESSCRSNDGDALAVPSFTAEVIFRVQPLSGTPETFD